ncbi:hypothetical protein ACFX1T_023024 [Malus domestica]
MEDNYKFSKASHYLDQDSVKQNQSWYPKKDSTLKLHLQSFNSKASPTKASTQKLHPQKLQHKSFTYKNLTHKSFTHKSLTYKSFTHKSFTLERKGKASFVNSLDRRLGGLLLYATAP